MLDAAGLAQPGDRWLPYELEIPSEGRVPALIVFEPYLQYGEFTCSACG